MIAHHLKVVTQGQYGQAIVELDGQQIQNGLQALSLDLAGGEPNRATLDLRAPTVEFDGQVEVHLPEEARALLKRLGWTPPEETP